MGFLDKLKKTLWKSFFGEPERPSRAPRKVSKRRKSKSAAKKLKKKLPKKPPAKLKPAVREKASASKRKPVLKAQKVKVKVRPLPVKPPAPAPALKAPLKQEGVLIGTVTHFFPQVNAAAIKINAKSLSVGDEIYIKGVTTRFKTKIASMQINRVPVTQAAKGSEIGILVKKRVREGDEVYKL